jgi:hypothetical protein
VKVTLYTLDGKTKFYDKISDVSTANGVLTFKAKGSAAMDLRTANK